MFWLGPKSDGSLEGDLALKCTNISIDGPFPKDGHTEISISYTRTETDCNDRLQKGELPNPTVAILDQFQRCEIRTLLGGDASIAGGSLIVLANGVVKRQFPSPMQRRIDSGEVVFSGDVTNRLKVLVL